jgi:hypothetical protein
MLAPQCEPATRPIGVVLTHFLRDNQATVEAIFVEALRQVTAYMTVAKSEQVSKA